MLFYTSRLAVPPLPHSGANVLAEVFQLVGATQFHVNSHEACVALLSARIGGAGG